MNICVINSITNEVFWAKLRVVCISNKIRKRRLRWSGHLRRRQTTKHVKSVETLAVEGKQSRCRRKLTWYEKIKHYLSDLHISENISVIGVLEGV
jgi:hypothetical protein